MIYTEVIKKELDTILKAFEGYIQNQNYFDIVYSEKIGYVWLIIDPPGAAGAELLDTPEKMLDALFNDIISEVINAPENTTHIPDALTLTEYEETESRRRIASRATHIVQETNVVIDISIHAPARARRHTRSRGTLSQNFNPRPPHGGRPASIASCACS